MGQSHIITLPRVSHDPETMWIYGWDISCTYLRVCGDEVRIKEDEDEEKEEVEEAE